MVLPTHHCTDSKHVNILAMILPFCHHKTTLNGNDKVPIVVLFSISSSSPHQDYCGEYSEPSKMFTHGSHVKSQKSLKYWVSFFRCAILSLPLWWWYQHPHRLDDYQTTNQFIKVQTPFQPFTRNMHLFVGHRLEFFKGWNSGNILTIPGIFTVPRIGLAIVGRKKRF